MLEGRREREAKKRGRERGAVRGKQKTKDGREERWERIGPS